MKREKIQEAIRLLEECLNDEEGYEDESDEGMESDDSMPAAPSGGDDKTKMALAVMRRGK